MRYVVGSAVTLALCLIVFDSAQEKSGDSVVQNEKTGSCPKVVINGSCGSIPVRNCIGDDSCPGNQKCCSDGCDRNCRSPEGSCSEDSTEEKPGTCPKPGPRNNSCGFIPVRNCKGDQSCPGNQKCCTDGCDYNCQHPEASEPEEFPIVAKEGICPISYFVGTCAGDAAAVHCTQDGECPDKLKCCSNGCGRACKEPSVPDVFQISFSK